MFRGNTSVAMDSKGRMAIPTKYRDKLKEVCDEKLVVTIHPNDKCLMLYPLNKWEVIEKALIAVKSLDKRTTQVKRFFIGNAADCEMDGQGRILIPDQHRKYADLTKNMTLAGQVEYFEIWERNRWDEKNAIGLDDIPDLTAVPGLEEFTF